MGRSDCGPDRYTFHLAIAACARMSDFEFGFWIGGVVRSRGLGSDLLVATALIGLYSKAGEFGLARKVFDEMPSRDVVAWNAMISGYSQGGFLFEAVDLFRKMRFVHRVLPSDATLVSVISAYGDLGDRKSAELFHAHVIKIGFEINLSVSNSLTEMYNKCGNLDAAAALFDWMLTKDEISWSSMIGGYVQHGRPDDALKLFRRMAFDEGVKPTRPMLLNVLLACAELGDWREGKWIEENYILHDSIGFGTDSSLLTTLVYMYAKCGKFNTSLNLLKGTAQVREDVIAWNAVIKACIELGNVDMVFELALQMQRRGIAPDSATFLLVLSLVSLIPSLKKGMETHAHVIKRGFRSENPIANSLISMYSRSGSVGHSLEVFNGVKEKDVVSWSSIIQAYALNGKVDEALDLFDVMRRTEVRPNHYTFLAVLSACSHGGLVEKGWRVFKLMKEDYGLEPEIEHFTSMVDMFCRAARLADAYNLLKNGISQHGSNSALWGTLLSACRLHGDLVIAEAAAKQLLMLEPQNAANYKMLADAYISAGRREEAIGVLGLLRESQLEKRTGYSWFEGG